jgi:hypothetical protein
MTTSSGAPSSSAGTKPRTAPKLSPLSSAAPDPRSWGSFIAPNRRASPKGDDIVWTAEQAKAWESIKHGCNDAKLPLKKPVVDQMLGVIENNATRDWPEIVHMALDRCDIPYSWGDEPTGPRLIIGNGYDA